MVLIFNLKAYENKGMCFCDYMYVIIYLIVCDYNKRKIFLTNLKAVQNFDLTNSSGTRADFTFIHQKHFHELQNIYSFICTA